MRVTRDPCIRILRVILANASYVLHGSLLMRMICGSLLMRVLCVILAYACSVCSLPTCVTCCTLTLLISVARDKRDFC